MRLALVLCLIAAPLAAETSPYAGQEGRAISSLSAEDVAALEAGLGWELAKPAELNGWPGPRHALDLGAELDLSAEQKADLERLFAEMQAEVRRVGAQYLEAEAALDAAFRSGDVDPARLSDLTAEAGRAWAALRAVHLGAHLRTRAALSAEQVAAYSRLRGYDGGKAGGGHHGGH